MILTIIIFIITLLILVVIHELGHFLMAKRFDIKVLEFGFGIPPKAWGKKVGETLVSINWLPIGGFVRLLGEDEVDKKVLENHRSFAAKSVDKRIMVVVAGVVMNLLLAWLLFYLVLASQGFKTKFPLIIDHEFLGIQQNEQYIVINQVAKNSPAQEAGLKTGQRVTAINDQKLQDREEMVNKIKSLSGQQIKLTLQDIQQDQTKEVLVTPRVSPPVGEGPLGVGLGLFKVAQVEYQSPQEKLLSGPIHSINIVAYSGKILGNLISQSFEEKSFGPVSTSVAGPVGITNVANSVLSTTSPLLPYLEFIAILSLNLAVFNLLPIPALDGGRIFFLLIEVVTKRRVHAEFEKWVHTIGIAFLLALTLLITLSDIRKFF